MGLNLFEQNVQATKTVNPEHQTATFTAAPEKSTLHLLKYGLEQISMVRKINSMFHSWTQRYHESKFSILEHKGIKKDLRTIEVV